MAQKMSCSGLQQAIRFVHNLDCVDQIPFGHHVQWYLAHKNQPPLGPHSKKMPRVLGGS